MSAYRHPYWPTTRREFLANNGVCAGCGLDTHLEVHHIVPFHVDRSLELEPSNLVTLCDAPARRCHWTLGHLSLSWSHWNESVVEDAARFLERRASAKVDQRPHASRLFPLTPVSLELSAYQIANLRSVIEAARSPETSPIQVIDTGDWLGEIYNMLPEVDWAPNKTPMTLIEESRLRR